MGFDPATAANLDARQLHLPHLQRHAAHWRCAQVELVRLVAAAAVEVGQIIRQIEITRACGARAAECP